MLHVSAALPTTPEEITAQWLTDALRVEDPGVTVATLDISQIIWGTATKVLVEVMYRDADLPRHLCVKAGLDRRLDAVSNDAIHVTEAAFYGNLRHRFPTSAPRSFYAGTDPEGRTGLIVLEDLAQEGCTFVEAGDALSVDQVASGLRQQARWHAATWGATPGKLPGVQVGSINRKAAKFFFREDYWNAHFAQPDAPQYPAELQDPHRIYAAFTAMWARDDAAVHCFQHGDAHPGNTFLRPNDELGFIDWQCYCLGPWASDVAYFISGALTVEDRRAREVELLDFYLDQLVAEGGPGLDRDEAWDEYVRHLVHGLMWTMTPTVMQPIERTRAMSERHVASVQDHGVVGSVR